MKLAAGFALATALVGGAAQAASPFTGWFVLDRSISQYCVPLGAYARASVVPMPANPTPRVFVKRAVALGAPIVAFHQEDDQSALAIDQIGGTILFVNGYARCEVNRVALAGR